MVLVAFFFKLYVPYSPHQAVGYVHQHGGCEEEGAHAHHHNYLDQVYHYCVKCAVLVGAEEVVPTKQGEGVRRAGPGVDQGHHEVLYFVYIYISWFRSIDR